MTKETLKHNQLMNKDEFRIVSSHLIRFFIAFNYLIFLAMIYLDRFYYFGECIRIFRTIFLFIWDYIIGDPVS